MSEEDANHLAQELNKGRDETILFSSWVSKISNKQVDRRLFVITESTLSLYKKPRLSKNMKISDTHSWYELRVITMPTQTSIELHFVDDNFYLQSELVQPIVDIISKYLVSIMTTNELPKIEIPGFHLETIPVPWDAPMHHLRSKIFLNQSTIPAQILNDFQIFLTAAPSSLSIAHLNGIEQYYGPIIRSLALCPFLKKITFSPIHGQAHTVDIAKFIRSNQYVEDIVFDMPIEDDFNKIIAAFDGLTTHAIRSVTFTCPIHHQASDLISQISQFYPIESYIFAGNSKRRFCLTFSKHLAGSKHFSNVKKVSFKKVPANEISPVIETLANVSELGIINSDLDISTFFGTSHKTNSITFDLSGNMCMKGPYNYSIPPSINELNLDGVQFQSQHLANILAICGQRTNFVLSLNHAQGNEDVFNRFFASLSTTTGDFHGLKIDEIPLRTEIFEFLNKCKSLEVLSISGCLTSLIVQNFADFLATSKSIKELNIHAGRKVKLLPNEIEIILNALAKNQSVIKIDIGGNTFDDSTWTKLGETLMTNKVVEEVNINGIEFNSINQLNNFVGQMEKREKSIKISWPFMEIKKFIEDNNGFERLNEIQNLWNKVQQVASGKKDGNTSENTQPSNEIKPHNHRKRKDSTHISSPEGRPRRSSRQFEHKIIDGELSQLAIERKPRRSSRQFEHKIIEDSGSQLAVELKPRRSSKQIETKIIESEWPQLSPEPVNGKWESAIATLPEPDMKIVFEALAQSINFNNMIEKLRSI